ncbi:hypothetical protein B5S28_g4291 [[Candida] boidinii]|nr:hypothetical protein B5S28_g4291 [[Candida] boidinii]
MDEKKLQAKLFDELATIVEEADADELYGHQIDPAGEYFDKEITMKLVAKLLKAYKNDYDETRKKLIEILKWRKEFDPISAAFMEKHDIKFDKLSAITYDQSAKANEKVITWNFYGVVKDSNEYFGDLKAFLRWRVGLMEQSLHLLDFSDNTNDYMVQIHDYKGVSMLKMDSKTKEGSKSVIKVFGGYYPEVLSRKFFINVPYFVTWIYSAVTAFVNEETKKKFVLVASGNDLPKYLGNQTPKEYGGKLHSMNDLLFTFSDKNKKAAIKPYTSYLIEQKFANELD